MSQLATNLPKNYDSISTLYCPSGKFHEYVTTWAHPGQKQEQKAYPSLPARAHFTKPKCFTPWLWKMQILSRLVISQSLLLTNRCRWAHTRQQLRGDHGLNI